MFYYMIAPLPSRFFLCLTLMSQRFTHAKLVTRLYSLIVLTELRYESFAPNHIRIPKEEQKFSEPWQLCIHIAIFAVLQALPQSHPTVLAFEVQLAIYIIWTSIQQILRYDSSPALFGPLYSAESLSSFWYRSLLVKYHLTYRVLIPKQVRNVAQCLCLSLHITSILAVKIWTSKMGSARCYCAAHWRHWRV